MQTGGQRRKIWTGAASAALLGLSSASMAQDAGGLEANLTFSQGLTYSDVDGTSGRTNLGFNLSSTTRTQVFQFGLNGGLSETFDDGFETELISPTASLNYGIENRDTELTTSVTYRQADADGFVEDPNGAPGILVIDEGTREELNANAGLTFGREAKFGGTFTLGLQDVAFSDTTSPELVDSRRTNAGLSLRFEIDRRITANLSYNWTETDRETGRDVVNEGLTAGAQLAVTQTLNANVSVGLTEITATDGAITSVEDGLTYNLGLNQERPNGMLRLSVSSDLSESGRRTTATVGRTLETPRGEFSADFGLTERTDDELRPLLTLSYGEDLPRGNYSVGLNQSFETNAAGGETLNSRLRFNWRQDLNTTSRMSSNLTYQLTDLLGADDDTSRLSVGFSFSQDLTEDWALTTRYTHSIVARDSEDTTRENEIFIGLETSVRWRP